MSSEDRRNWHQLSGRESAARLDVDVNVGLASDEAGRRLKQVGPNVLIEQGRRGIARILWDQLRGALILLLVGAAAVSAAWET